MQSCNGIRGRRAVPEGGTPLLSLDPAMVMGALGNVIGDAALQRYFCAGEISRRVRPVIAPEEFGPLASSVAETTRDGLGESLQHRSADQGPMPYVQMQSMLDDPPGPATVLEC